MCRVLEDCDGDPGMDPGEADADGDDAEKDGIGAPRRESTRSRGDGSRLHADMADILIETVRAR